MRGRTYRLRGSIVALVASVALHLVLIALLLSERPVPPPRRPVVSFEVELRRAPASAPPAVPAAPSRRSGGSRHAGAADPKAAPTRKAAAPDAFHGNALEGLEAPALRGAPDLHVRWPGVAPERDDEEVTSTSRDPLRDWTRELAGRARVDSGLVHPYYRDVGRALLRAWDAEGAIKKHGLSGYLAEAGNNIRTFGRVWQQMAQGGELTARVTTDSSRRLDQVQERPTAAAIAGGGHFAPVLVHVVRPRPLRHAGVHCVVQAVARR